MSEQLVNTYNYLVPAAGTTRSYRVTQNFMLGEVKHCDFRNMALDGVSFVPSGVLVDNTRGTGDCVITIIEFAWRIVVPAGAMINMPYPAPYNQTATIEGEGDVTVVFVDYPVIPFISNSGGGVMAGVTRVLAGDNISVDNTDPAFPIISSTGGGGGGGGGGIKIFYGVNLKDVIGDVVIPMDYTASKVAIGITNTGSEFYIPPDTKMIRFNVEVSTPYGTDPEPPVLGVFLDGSPFIDYPEVAISDTPNNATGVFTGSIVNLALEKDLSFRLIGKTGTQSAVNYAVTLELF